MPLGTELVTCDVSERLFFREMTNLTKCEHISSNCRAADKLMQWLQHPASSSRNSPVQVLTTCIKKRKREKIRQELLVRKLCRRLDVRTAEFCSLQQVAHRGGDDVTDHEAPPSPILSVQSRARNSFRRGNRSKITQSILSRNIFLDG